MLWSEHSERATIRTWAQAARVPEDVRKMIGRWRPTADEGYERNVRTNVLRFQKVLALFIKENGAKSDPFDETTAVQLIEQRMEAMGYERSAIDDQLMRLMTFMPGEDAAKACRMPKWTTTGPVIFVEDNEEMVEVAAESQPADPVKEEASEEENEPTKVVPLEKVAGTFVISIVGRSKTRTLHRVGECHRQPGVHYATFEVLGEETPSTAQYHRACRQCFGKADSQAMSALEDDSSGEVSSSEMTESASDSTG